jgi:hypothetical protein
MRSYVELIINFNREHRSNPFTDSALALYHAILARFNDTGTNNKPWKRYLKINNHVLRGDIRKSYNTYKAALDSLKEREMIDYRSKNGYRDIILCLESIPEGVTASDKISNDGNSILHKRSAKVAANPEEPETTTNSPVPEPPSGPKGGVIRRQLPSNETYSPDGDHPPDDGILRSWPELQRNLNELNIPPGDYKKIVQLSDYGRKGHPVWKAFHEINRKKGTKGAIERPGSWIQWYIKQAPPTATAPAEAAPSEPPPETPFLRPPDDGTNPLWDKLKGCLQELGCSIGGIRDIGKISGYGNADSPVWDALEKVKERDKNIPPGLYIMNYIRKNTT